MSAAVTGIITQGRYDYDVRLTTADGLTEVRLVEGMALVTAGISTPSLNLFVRHQYLSYLLYRYLHYHQQFLFG